VFSFESDVNRFITDNANNYVYFDVSDQTVKITTGSISYCNPQLGHVHTAGGKIWTIHQELPINDTLTRLIETIGEVFKTVVISGGVISEDTDVTNTWDVVLSPCKYYEEMHVIHDIPEIYSRTTNLFRWFKTGGNWTYDTNAEIDVVNYNDGTDRVPIPANKYVRSLFIIASNAIHWIYPTEYFNTVGEALDGNDPVIPTGLDHFPKSTALVLNQSDTSFPPASSDQWIDRRPLPFSTLSTGAVVNDHGSLLGLGDDDHLQYLLVDGTRAMTGTLQVDTISEASTDAGVTIDSVLIKDNEVTVKNLYAIDGTKYIHLIPDTAGIQRLIYGNVGMEFKSGYGTTSEFYFSSPDSLTWLKLYLVDAGDYVEINATDPIKITKEISITETKTTSHNSITVTPQTSLGASAQYSGLYLGLLNLDPSDAGVVIYGTSIAASDISQTNNPSIIGHYIQMPVTYTSSELISALRAEGNGIILDICDGTYAINTDGSIKANNLTLGSGDTYQVLLNPNVTANRSFTFPDISGQLLVDTEAAEINALWNFNFGIGVTDTIKLEKTDLPDQYWEFDRNNREITFAGNDDINFLFPGFTGTGEAEWLFKDSVGNYFFMMNMDENNKVITFGTKADYYFKFVNDTKIGTNLVIINAGAGDDPVIYSNNAIQLLSLTGTLRVSKDIYVDDKLGWMDGTGNLGTFYHANTVDRSYSFPDRNITVAGTDDVAVVQSDVDGFPDELKNLSTEEIQQIENIGLTTITSDQWAILGELAGTLTATELNYVDGVTSAIQTQLDGKSPLSGSTSIDTVGTITTGVWHGTAITDSWIDDDITSKKLKATDDRDFKPNTESTWSMLKIYFTTLGGMTDVADTDYQDLLIINTYIDGTGGDINALTFDKSEKKIRHWLADQTDSTWGSPKTLAYVEDTMPLSGGTFTGNVTLNDSATLYFANGTTYYVDTLGNAKFLSVNGMTDAEMSQIENINANTISETQWGYLGVLDQNLRTNDSPTFAGLTLVNAITEFSTDVTLGDNLDSAVPTEKAVKTYTDSNFVALTGDQTIAGIKTFSSVPVCSIAPTSDTQLVNKAYVTDYSYAKSTLDARWAKGSANKKWHSLSMDPRIQSDSTIDFSKGRWGLSNIITGNPYFYCHIDLPPLVSSLKLYIDDIKVRLSDADGNNEISEITVDGQDDTSSTEILNSGVINYNTAAVYTLSTVATDVSNYSSLTIRFKCTTNVAGALDIAWVKIGYYYDT